MTSFAKIFAVMGLLFVTTLAAEEQNFIRRYFEAFDPFYTRVAQNVNQSLTYMVCGWTKGWATYNCYIQLNLVDGFEKYCKLTLPHLKKHDHLYSMITNKALVEWTFIKYGMEYKRLTLYDINSCNSIDIDFPFDHHYHLLVYDNSFHVTTKNKEKCGQEHSPCMIRYNHDGEQIGEPVPFPSKNYRQGYAMVVDRHNSSSGGFFTTYEKIDRNEYQMNVSRVSNDGTEMVLLKNYVVRKNVEGAQVQSNEYGYFSFCHRQFELRGVITCTQYDAMGKLIIDGKMTSVAQILVVMGLLFVATIAVKKQDFSKNYSEPYYSLYHRLAKNFNQSLAYVMCNATNFGGLYSIMANKALFELSLVNDSAEYKGIALIDMNNCNSVHLDFPDDDYIFFKIYQLSFRYDNIYSQMSFEHFNANDIRVLKKYLQ
ncbi:uncharacterized protein LOC106647903, partial [Copidosoma floridanum]|uniref:uncharacterized protein LOC106647903 n=1 Tax=Copidosoma floridanum TaxID=29053 RepID=UPI000C6FC2C5